MPNLLKPAIRGLRTAFASQVEAAERLALLNRPWAEEHLHWARAADGTWILHGTVLPPKHGWRRFSVTRAGWCPGLRRL
jgi:hypothetical protein